MPWDSHFHWGAQIARLQHLTTFALMAYCPVLPIVPPDDPARMLMRWALSADAEIVRHPRLQIINVWQCPVTPPSNNILVRWTRRIGSDNFYIRDVTRPGNASVFLV